MGGDATRQGLAIELLLNLQPKARMSTISLHAQRRRKFTESAENRGKANAVHSRWEFMLLRNICSSPVAEGEGEEEEKLRILIIFPQRRFALFGFGTL